MIFFKETFSSVFNAFAKNYSKTFEFKHN